MTIEICPPREESRTHGTCVNGTSLKNGELGLYGAIRQGSPMEES